MKINEIPHSFKLSRVSFLQWCVKEAAVAAVFMLSLTYSRSSDQEIAFFFLSFICSTKLYIQCHQQWEMRLPGTDLNLGQKFQEKKN